MKLQVAIDRVSLDQAKEVVKKLDGVVDIIELGTSLVKDYGLLQLSKDTLGMQKSELLLDLKTIDEGRYEFEKGFEVGADILTVMGAASVGTLETTYQVANQASGQMFIDLMEVTNEKIAQLTQFDQAIYGLHHAKDSQDGFDAAEAVATFVNEFPHVKRINVAGGIDLATAKQLKEQGLVETVIVGSKIMKSADPVAQAQKFMEVIHAWV